MRPVSNESSSIVRMLGQVQLPGCTGVDLYPQELQQQIDALNDQVNLDAASPFAEHQVLVRHVRTAMS